MKKIIYILSLLGIVAIPDLKAENDRESDLCNPYDCGNYARDRDAIPRNDPDESTRENNPCYPNGRDN